MEAPTVDTGARNGPGQPSSQWGIGGPVVRLGLSEVRTIGKELADRIENERRAHGAYRDMRDLARRVAGTGKPLSVANLEALATADAFACLPAPAGEGDTAGPGRPRTLSRREALWAAGAAAQERPDRLPAMAMGVRAPVLPGMDEVERMVADVWTTGLSPDSHPAQFARAHLTSLGALPIAALSTVEDGGRVLVGGIVTHRQRPATAGGITFINLEDETGMLNVVCSPGLWQRYRRVARSASAMLVRGRLECAEGVVGLAADQLAPLALPIRSPSRDFR
jgi:error-prone DNA polymerase